MTGPAGKETNAARQERLRDVVLAALRRAGRPIAVPELLGYVPFEDLNVDRSTLLTFVRRMVAAGLVQRVTDADLLAAARERLGAGGRRLQYLIAAFPPVTWEDLIRVDGDGFGVYLARDRRNTLLAFFTLWADEWLNDGATEACRVLSIWRYDGSRKPQLDGDHDPAEIAKGTARQIAEVLVDALEAGDLDMDWRDDRDIAAEFEERYDHLREDPC